MAVIYMRKLEEEPETYDSKFTTLTKGVNLEVHDWILNNIQSENSVLEIGCGTGILASDLALKGNDVVAIDKNLQMINYAMKNYPEKQNLQLMYQIGSFSDFEVPMGSKDIIISKFMLSELRPFEQQLFLRFAWKSLKPNGRLLVAAEFLPSGFWKLPFKIKRWRYKKKLRRLRLRSTFLVKWFFNYLNPIGFKVNSQKKWKHGSIRVLELIKINYNQEEEPGYYHPKPKKFKGVSSQLRIFRCIFTGQIDHVPIEPGIYQSGNPTKDSPIIVTANYEFTYYKVMRDLEGIDAWVLCLDSEGINVWCAARGNNFGNKQLLEAIQASGITSMTEQRTLILPQLSAGGISIPQLPKKSNDFPYKVKYGPIWSKYLPEYIKDKPTSKPDYMKLAKFSLFHRLRALITHTTFLFRKIFFLPILALLVLFLILGRFNQLWWIGELCLNIIVANFLISLLFPISNFTRRFIYKGIFFGVINIFILGALAWIFHGSLIYIIWNICFYFWISFFSTMSFSGYSMATSPREIQTEYPIFRKINLTLLIITLILLCLSILINPINLI